jgi:serine protease Do/serine protease DegQ
MLYSVERGSPAWVAGLRSYDIVTSVNRQPVANLEQFKQLVSNQPELLLNIVRDNQAMFLLLR